MPRFPRKGEERIGGGREGDVFLEDGIATKRFKRTDGTTGCLAKSRFYAHQVGSLLFPQHVLKLNYAGAVGRRLGVFTTSEFQNTTPVPQAHQHLVEETKQKLEAAGILCDPGSPSNANHAFKNGTVFFFEVNLLDEEKVMAHLTQRSDLRNKKEAVLRALNNFNRNWREYCEETKRAALGNR